MSPEEQNPPTEVTLYIRRANPPEEKGGHTPPPPLADPLCDINILPGNAKSYEVKAGQYIQVLDVQGRECSDFQALSRRALDKGLEREIDPTTTRSLMGNLYPAPGIYSKYFSMDQEPLIEIVQDTCGRHDTFNLACTARYYEDLGYPGHVNCSDNINADIAQYGIKPRGGWPSINFFFNTLLDDANTLSMDDPWSRPGDYVLLRALTDLICVSTACPCDVDPANVGIPLIFKCGYMIKQTEISKHLLGGAKRRREKWKKQKKPVFTNALRVTRVILWTTTATGWQIR